MVYLAGGGHLTNADLIKKRGEGAVLFYYPMERDEAAKSGLNTKNIGDYNFNHLLKDAGGDHLKALVNRYKQMLTELEITSGSVALYGRAELGANFALFSALQQAVPEINFIGEYDNSTLMLARFTKDDGEIERIRSMGKITTQVVGKVADFLTSRRVRNDVLLNSNSEILTIADVKRQISLWLVELGAENPEGTIFAIGHDAGVPHSSGNPGDPLKLGQTIVFDIFPCEAGGGYFYDFTRTWCLGYAPDDVFTLYETVLSVYNKVTGQLQVGEHFKEYQELTCDLFSAQGHPTIRENPQTLEGYVHSLGHGIGLNIHERPWSGINSDEKDRLLPGAVFTIEPGLYYPKRNMGIRLENSFCVSSDGRIELLADYPLDLVLPVKNGRP
jgi:Xaa-Pro aminopeptidase